VLALLIVVACAPSLPPPELRDARVVFERTKSSAASEINPAGVFEASKALDTAETRQQKKAGSSEARALAYIALRKSLRADVDTRTELAQAEQKRAEAVLERMKRGEPVDTQELVATSEVVLPDIRRDNVEGSSERNGKIAAANPESKAKDKLASIGELASVKDDSRGMVVTIAGGALASTDAALTPSVRDGLNEVAVALEQMPDRSITVYGYSDAVGSDEGSVELSRERAEAVRRHLVSRGIEQERIRAEGRGKQFPIASNATPDGRAANRRVEIVVEHGSP
jgi:outer membrane protein OmpA-like peptidoglycan-associated protein